MTLNLYYIILNMNFALLNIKTILIEPGKNIINIIINSQILIVIINIKVY